MLIDLGLDDVEPKSIVGGATDRSHGDIAIPCHKFAGVLRRPPAEIAEEVAGKLSPYLDKIAYVSSKSGFVNVTATPKWLSSRLVEFYDHPHSVLRRIP